MNKAAVNFLRQMCQENVVQHDKMTEDFMGLPIIRDYNEAPMAHKILTQLWLESRGADSVSRTVLRILDTIEIDKVD